MPGRSLQENGTPVTTLPSVIVEDVDGAGQAINAAFRLQIAFSITGPLRLPDHADSLTLLDSIVDGLGGAAIAAARIRTTSQDRRVTSNG